jgi:hypothetical protein
VVKILELRRVFKQMRDESHATVGVRLRNESNARLVKGDVQVSAQEQRISRIIECGCRTSVVPRHIVGSLLVYFGLGHDVCNLQLLAAPAETTRAIAEEQGGRKVGRRESDARRGGV